MKSQNHPHYYAIGPRDLDRLFRATLALRGHTGFDAIQTCSDLNGKFMTLAKAEAVLGWFPKGG